MIPKDLLIEKAKLEAELGTWERAYDAELKTAIQTVDLKYKARSEALNAKIRQLELTFHARQGLASEIHWRMATIQNHDTPGETTGRMRQAKNGTNPARRNAKRREERRRTKYYA